MANPTKRQSRPARAAVSRMLALCCLATVWAAAGAAAQPVQSAPLPLTAAAVPVQTVPTVEMAYRYGEAYDDGRGVPQDFAAAAYWYRLAAERGYPPAQLALASYYARGVGVAEDIIQGYVWANRSASGMVPGTLEYRSAVELRDYFRFKLTAEQMAQAQRLATGWPPLPSDP
jgi:TPR repeat protein